MGRFIALDLDLDDSWLVSSPALWHSSQAPTPPRPALLCWSGKVQRSSQLYCIAQARFRLALPSVAQLSPALMTLRPALPPATGGKGQGEVISPSPMPPHATCGQIFCFHTFGTSSVVPPPAGSALLCFPGKGQAQLLVLVRCRASSPTLMTSEAALLPATGSKVGRTSCSPIDCFTYKIVKENCHISIMYMIHNNQK